MFDCVKKNVKLLLVPWGAPDSTTKRGGCDGLDCWMILARALTMAFLKMALLDQYLSPGILLRHWSPCARAITLDKT